MMEPITVAAVQHPPVFLDRDATVEKTCALIAEAAGRGARLVVFPEAFLPGYPDWVWRTRPWENGDAWYGRLLENSVVVPSDATEKIGAAAAKAGAYVALGVDERDEAGGTVYNTLLYFGSDGSLLGRHRKLMPTGGERLVWGYGDGSSFDVHDTPFGRVGGLLCWENYMPLARAAVYAKGVDVWVAPTWDQSDTWVATLRHIAKEGRMYVIGAAPAMKGSDIPAGLPNRDELYGDNDEWFAPGYSTIVSPGGEILAGPLVKETGILYAEIDANAARASRYEFDPIGHYARPDVLRLVVEDAVRAPVSFGPAPAAGERPPRTPPATGAAPKRSTQRRRG